MKKSKEEQIAEFTQRIADDGREFCEGLFHNATVNILAHKYAYYVLNGHFIDDYTYDMDERSWYIMGRALGLLQEDETSPCVDFNENHPLAKEGIALAKSLKLRR